MRTFSFTTFQVVAGGLAGLVALCMVWLLAVEIVRPAAGYVPSNEQDAELYASLAGQARAAASIGVLRGDLWSLTAVADASQILFRSKGQAPAGASNIDDARSAAIRAASLSPHDARVWIILAGLQSRASQPSKMAADALKLSYYTGPNDVALAPLRLLVAAAIPWDDDLKGMVRSEILRLILERPDLKPAIVAAFQTAIPAVRPTFESLLNEADPALLGTTRSQPQRK